MLEIPVCKKSINDQRNTLHGIEQVKIFIAILPIPKKVILVHGTSMLYEKL